MTKEQKEAIRILETQASIKERKNHYLIFHKEATEIVLNMVKEKNKEIEKKDKMIDLMTEWIKKHTKYYDEDGCYCEVEKDICKKDIECKVCIKQYFERKAEEN